MAKNLINRWQNVSQKASRCLTHPFALGALPLLSLVLYRLAGELALIGAAVAVPVVLLLFSTTATGKYASAIRNSAVIGLMQYDGFRAITQQVFDDTRDSGLHSALFTIEIDNHAEFVDMYGQSAAEKAAKTVGGRLVSILRDDDAVVQSGDWAFTVCLEPVRQLDLELCIQLASRMQRAVEEPIAIDGTTVYVTACVGFSQNNKALARSAQAWRDAARGALRQAQMQGPNTIRAFSKEMRLQSEARAELREEIVAALDNGQIKPWFQPQISTDTGQVTGFEALARWEHPTKGMIAPSEFLGAAEQAGMLERLAEVMIFYSFTALAKWDRAGVMVPQVGVNFAGPELNNPKLIDKIKWELDRFDLAPERLAVEVLETVVAHAPDDTVTRNINGLGALGCRIDLDDFGTGQTSIASIRRFAVSRIKIDRSFVMKADRDPEQQRMISAILTMAERLNVETLAEGVETVGEHALLAQLGCDHVQGFGIAKPMPFEKTIEWITTHNAKLQSTAKIIGNQLR